MRDRRAISVSGPWRHRFKRWSVAIADPSSLTTEDMRPAVITRDLVGDISPSCCGTTVNQQVGPIPSLVFEVSQVRSSLCTCMQHAGLSVSEAHSSFSKLLTRGGFLHLCCPLGMLSTASNWPSQGSKAALSCSDTCRPVPRPRTLVAACIASRRNTWLVDGGVRRSGAGEH